MKAIKTITVGGGFKALRLETEGKWLVLRAEDCSIAATTYLNGKKLVTWDYDWMYDDGRIAAQAHILLNLVICASWVGCHGVDDSKFPQALEVDYAREYRKQSCS